MREPRPQSRNGLVAFFSLTLALSIPFWLLGDGRLPVPLKLPVSALAFVCPLLAALILAFREQGGRGVARLLSRVLDYGRIRDGIWFLPILLLLPVTFAASYGILRLLGRPLPEPDIRLEAIPILLVLFFVTAAGEEVGYMAYAADRMQRRWTALTAALVLGAVWGLMHVVPDLQNDHGIGWIVSQRAVYSVAFRVLIVWIYNNTGRSLFAAILFHDTDNVSVSLFPNWGSHYDPAVTGVLTAMVAAVVTFLWGPRTLARYRFGEGRPVTVG